jgi:hypothetical protein
MEASIYKALGLQFIEPELREGRGGIALAQKGLIPKLVELQDIRGILHAHTDQSDGGNSLEEMAAATRKRGYEYFGVADHSQSPRYAGGLSLDQIRQQHAEIDRLNAGSDRDFHMRISLCTLSTAAVAQYPVELTSRASSVSVHVRARVMGSYSESEKASQHREMLSNAVAVLLLSGRDQPSSLAVKPAAPLTRHHPHDTRRSGSGLGAAFWSEFALQRQPSGRQATLEYLATPMPFLTGRFRACVSSSRAAYNGRH